MCPLLEGTAACDRIIGAADVPLLAPSTTYGEHRTSRTAWHHRCALFSLQLLLHRVHADALMIV